MNKQIKDRKLIRNVLGSATACALMSTTTLAADIQLEVSNIEKQSGHVLVVLYNSKEAYSNSEAPLMQKKMSADSDKISATFEGLEAGNYAIKLFHDENDNGQLDTNFIGLPTEGYGFSNNAGRFGPAEYEEAVFSVNEDTQVSISLR